MCLEGRVNNSRLGDVNENSIGESHCPPASDLVCNALSVGDGLRSDGLEQRSRDRNTCAIPVRYKDVGILKAFRIKSQPRSNRETLISAKKVVEEQDCIMPLQYG